MKLGRHLGWPQAKSKETLRVFTRSDGLGSRRRKYNSWEAVTPWSLLISQKR